MSLTETIRAAGIVGAGGGGFPTYVKAQATVEFVLANGAECEPLIHKDFEIMLHHPKEIVRGMQLMMEKVNARKGYFGIKSKNQDAIDAIKPFLKGTNIEMTELGDFYPSGDEYELVYEATKRLIPAGGIPLDVGCVVNNVETFYNIARAEEGHPLTEKFLCVTGAVKNPSSFFIPIGATYRDAIQFAGGATVADFGVFVGGLMMGQLVFDLDLPITKTTAGFIVLPKDHYMIKRMNQPEENWFRIGKSACDQCSYCTEFCPRYLLGYDVQPHKVMRSLGFTKTGGDFWNQMAELCCSCGLCTLYACPEDLYPKEACGKSKKEMRQQGVKYVQQKPVKVHPMKDGRRVPIKQLMQRLNVLQYNAHTPFIAEGPQPKQVKILLKQHVGTPASPVVTKGATVQKGDMIGKVDEKQMGVPVHASISGIVTDITNEYIIISKQEA